MVRAVAAQRQQPSSRGRAHDLTDGVPIIYVQKEDRVCMKLYFFFVF